MKDQGPPERRWVSDAMTAHRPAKISAALLLGLLGLLGLLATGSARAADRPCAAMVVEADDRVRGRWPELPARIHEAFDARDDVDACAFVRLTMTDASVRVEVILPDGRAAARSVWWRDVVPALAALLLVPDRDAQAEAPDPGPSGARLPAPVGMAPGDPALRQGAALAPSTETEPSRLRIEFSVVTGTRLGNGQSSVGLGVLSFLDIGGWLLGFEGRFDHYQPLGPGEPAIELALAPLAGRRFRFGTVALDLTAGPALALQGTTTFETPAAAPGGQPIIWTNAATAGRLLLGARVNFRARSVLRGFVGLDADIGLTRDRVSWPADQPTLPPQAPRLPDWSAGLVLGATVGTL